MKLARPYRMAPLAIAHGAGGRADERGARPTRRSTPIASADVAPPGFLNLRLRDGALEATVAAILADPPAWGRVAPTRAALGQRRVRVGQPDRAAPRRQRPRRVHRRPAQPRPRGRRPAGHARVLLQRLGRARSATSARRSPRSGAASRCPRTATTATTSTSSRPRCPTTSGPPPPPTAPTPTAVLGRWAAGRVREGIEASLEALGVHFDVWTSEATLHDEGWVERAVERLRERGHVYEQDGARLVPLDRLRRRQGPGHLSARTASRPTSRPTSAT